VFVEKNVRADQAALKELLDLGYQSTPVTLIEGEAVVGFDQIKIVQLLGL
jgi:glutaredoxin 3